eukprot:351524_1
MQHADLSYDHPMTYSFHSLHWSTLIIFVIFIDIQQQQNFNTNHFILSSHCHYKIVFPHASINTKITSHSCLNAFRFFIYSHIPHISASFQCGNNCYFFTFQTLYHSNKSPICIFFF